MQSSIIKIIKISVYVDVLKILASDASTLTKWLKDFQESGDILARGSVANCIGRQKEIARLRRELRDAQMHIWTIAICLSGIMDLFSRKIIAWTLSETLEVSCVIDTINKAQSSPEISTSH